MKECSLNSYMIKGTFFNQEALEDLGRVTLQTRPLQEILVNRRVVCRSGLQFIRTTSLCKHRLVA